MSWSKEIGESEWGSMWKYGMWLSTVKGISLAKKRKMNPKLLYHNIEEMNLYTEYGLSDKQILSLKESKKTWEMERQMEVLRKKNIAFVPFFTEEYPEKLLKIPSSPYGLYVKGKLPNKKKRSVAIIGARMCSNYGKGMASLFAKELAVAGVEIVSGMAHGIDSIAQKSALDARGMTFAVLGCSVDICYPRENFSLYMDILEKGGGILSEYPPSTPPLAKNFPARNRIISGLSDAVLVMEAKEKSGSLITADMALEQGRDVYALPGDVTSALSRGCNQLLRQGAGVLISPGETLLDLGIINTGKKQEKNENKIMLESAENMVYSCLGLHPKSLEELSDEISMNIPELLDILIALEIKGCICEIGKNYYARVESTIEI